MCGSLGDFFPNELKNQFATEQLKVGAVIKAFSKEAGKVKRMIIVGIDEQNIYLSSVLINSKLSQIHLNNPTLYADILEFKPNENRKYLDHKSFIDCSEIHIEPIHKFKEAISNNPNAYLDCVSNSDLTLIRDTIKNSKNIKAHIKKRFGLFY